MKSLIILLLGLVAANPGVAAPGTYDLKRCVNRALEANRDLLIAKTEEERAGQQVREAWAGAFPQLTLNGTFNRNFQLQKFYFGDDFFSGLTESGDTLGGEGAMDPAMPESDGVEIGTDYDYRATIDLRQPIWLGGKVGAAVRAARSFDQLTRNSAEASRRSIVHQAKILFYSALLARDELAIYRASQEQARRHFETTTIRGEQGLASRFEVLRAEVELANQETPRIEGENRYKQALNRLQVLLALPVGGDIEITGEFRYSPIPLERLQVRRGEAKEHRPDRLATLHNVNVRKQVLRASRGDRLPNLYLLGSYGFQGASNDLEFSARERSTFSSLSLEVGFPFWTSGATTARIGQARADLRIAELRLELMDEEVKREVRSAVLNLEAADDRVYAFRKSLKLAEQAYEIAETSYENGLLSQLELLDAKDALTESRVNAIRAVNQALVAQAEWELAVGADWEEQW